MPAGRGKGHLTYFYLYQISTETEYCIDFLSFLAQNNEMRVHETTQSYRKLVTEMETCSQWAFLNNALLAKQYFVVALVVTVTAWSCWSKAFPFRALKVCVCVGGPSCSLIHSYPRH
jgi:hypothetical protein